jgi:hypothetical protein
MDGHASQHAVFPTPGTLGSVPDQVAHSPECDASLRLAPRLRARAFGRRPCRRSAAKPWCETTCGAPGSFGNRRAGFVSGRVFASLGAGLLMRRCEHSGTWNEANVNVRFVWRRVLGSFRAGRCGVVPLSLTLPHQGGREPEGARRGAGARFVSRRVLGSFGAGSWVRFAPGLGFVSRRVFSRPPDPSTPRAAGPRPLPRTGGPDTAPRRPGGAAARGGRGCVAHWEPSTAP